MVRFRDFFARRRQKAVMVNLIDMWAAMRPLADLWDIKKFADEGYRRNSLIFACICIKATSFMGPDLYAYAQQGDEEVRLPNDHMLSQILARPNKRDSQSAFMRKWQTNLDVAGNAYALKVRANTGMPVQLRILRPDLIRPIPNREGEIVAYEYGKLSSAGGYTKEQIEEGKESSGYDAQVLPAEDVIHEIAAPDPLNPYRGLSPIAVLARMGDLDNYASDYLRSFFLNAGIPSGILKIAGQTTRDQRTAVREQWKERYGLRTWDSTQTGGAFDLFVTDSDVEYQEIGSKLRMMDLGSVFGETESRICGTMGVHPVLVAAWIGLQRSTMANYEQARQSLYRDTLMPAWISTADRFGELAEEFGSNIYCQFDFSEISELQEDKSAEKELALQAYNDGIITKNEAREVWGYDQDGSGDVFKENPSLDYTPAGIINVMPDVNKLAAGQNKAALPAPKEAHASRIPPEWKVIQKIADNASPKLKKKYSQQ